jgi:AcrR family transcriptional regulator
VTSAVSDHPAPGRRERRKREIHERIVEAAIALFERKGFAGTTALEIAESADVAEKTFYNHFPTKQHLIQELAESSVEETAGRLAEARRFPGSTGQRLRHFFERSADAAEQSSRELTREVLLELVRVAQVDGVGPERNRHLHAAFAAMLEEGRARGDVAPDRDLDFLSELAVAAYLGIIINWVTLSDYPLRERLASLADLVSESLSGVAAPQTGKVLR